jgi:allene oxide cyclase
MKHPVTFLLCSILLAGAVQAADKLEFIEHAKSDFTLDLGAAGDSAGDLLTFANPLFDPLDKAQIGIDQGYCVRVAVGKSWECSITTILDGGQIMVTGPFNDKGDSMLAVIGGTGKYAGAKGQMLLHTRDAKGSAYDFRFELQ